MEMERHFHRTSNIKVILFQKTKPQKAESTISFLRGEIYAASEHKDFHAAIDRLAHRLGRQLIKKKNLISILWNFMLPIVL